MQSRTLVYVLVGAAGVLTLGSVIARAKVGPWSSLMPGLQSFAEASVVGGAFVLPALVAVGVLSIARLVQRLGPILSLLLLATLLLGAAAAWASAIGLLPSVLDLVRWARH